MKIGDKVVCIKTFHGPSERGTLFPWSGKFPKKDEIYILSWVGVYHNTHCCRLVGFHELDKWNLVGFRPVQPIDLWNRDEQESYLEYVEQIAPGVERETVEK